MDGKGDATPTGYHAATPRDAEKTSRKRAAEDETTPEAEDATVNLGDAEEQLARNPLKRLKANSGGVVGVTAGSGGREGKEVAKIQHPLSEVGGGGPDFLSGARWAVEGMAITELKVGTGRGAEKGAQLYLH